VGFRGVFWGGAGPFSKPPPPPAPAYRVRIFSYDRIEVDGNFR
jgi:hypothetical protein